MNVISLRSGRYCGHHGTRPIVILFMTAGLMLSAMPAIRAGNDLGKATDALSNFKGKGFLENKGQVYDQNYLPNTSVKYLFPLKNMNVELKAGSFSYDTYLKDDSSGVFRFHRVDVNFVGGNIHAKLIAEQPSSSYFNYYNAVTPESGATQVRHYGNIIYKDIYPGIDVEFIAKPGTAKPFEYNFILHPGADISHIQLRYEGMNESFLKVDELGFSLAHGTLTETIPLSYWKESGGVEKIHYQIVTQTNESVTVGFFGKSLTIDKTFIIDPTPSLSWSTYYGGAGFDENAGNFEGGDVCSDASSNAIIAVNIPDATGVTASSGAHQNTFGGNSDAMLVKFDPNGILQWATFYGGSGGESAVSVEADAANNIFILGYTSSSSAIATAGTHQSSCVTCDGSFIAKFDLNGVRQWGTYYYGNGNGETPHDLTLDFQGNVLICGITGSTSGIATPGSFRSTYIWSGGTMVGWFAKLDNSNGTRVWGSYITDPFYPWSIACDPTGNVLMTGGGGAVFNPNVLTPGAHQTTAGGSAEAIIVKFDPNGTTLMWGTLYGGVAAEEGRGIACDNLGNVYASGYTQSTNNIATPGSHQTTLGAAVWTMDGYLVKFNSAGVRQWGTYYGGNWTNTTQDRAMGLAIDQCGNIVMTGESRSPNNIASAGSFQSVVGGPQEDFYVAKFDPNGVRKWGSYLGGNGTEHVRDVDVAPNGQIYVMGATQSSNMPVTAGAYQSAMAGIADAFLFCFNDSATKPAIASSGGGSVCPLGSATLTISAGNLGAADKWYWYEGGCGSTLVDSGLTHIMSPTVTTTFYVRGEGACMMPGNCGIITVTVSPSPTITISGTSSVCQGSAASITASGGTSYSWNNGSTTAAISTTPTSTITYTVTGRNANGCTSTAQRTLTVNSLPSVTIAGNSTLCSGNSTTLSGSGASTYQWSNGATSSSINVSPTSTTTFTLTGTTSGCSNTTQQSITVNPLPSLAISGFTALCPGSSTTLTASGGSTYSWSTGATTTTITETPTSNTTYTLTGTSAAGCTNTVQQAVTVGNPPIITITGNITICAGSTTTLSATGGATYSWSTGATTTTITQSPTTTTTYSVTGTAVGGCNNIGQQTVTVNNLPLASISGNNSVCQGSTIILSASGGTTYSWNTGSTTTSLTDNPTTNTTYSVIVTDGNNCTNAALKTITINNPPLATINGSSSVCTGNTATLTASGGTTYAWDDGSTTPLLTVSPTTATTYSVTVTDNNGCNDTATITVTVNNNLSPSITGSNILCQGSSTTLSTSGGVSYSWNTGGTSNSINLSPIGTDSYTVTVTDASGCSGSAIITVTVNTLPLASISTNGSGNICQGSTISLSAIGGTQYDWDTGATTNNIIVSPTTNTTYTVMVTGNNGCTNTATFPVAVNNLPTTNINGIASICQSGVSVLTAGGGIIYSWSDGSTASTLSVSPTVTTTYTLTVTDNNGCTNIATQIITVGAPSTFSITAELCQGETYLLPAGAITDTSGIYTATLINQAGCDSIVTTLLTITPLPTITISPTKDIVKEGESAVLHAGGGLIYTWDDGSTTSSLPISPIITTTYCVVGMNINGCVDTACVVIYVTDFNCNGDTLFVPTAFSPNNDGQNDEWHVYGGNCIKLLNVVVYDRWANVVYITEDMQESWDGTFARGGKNEPMDAAVFIYVIRATLFDNSTIIKKGNVTLIK